MRMVSIAIMSSLALSSIAWGQSTRQGTAQSSKRKGRCSWICGYTKDRNGTEWHKMATSCGEGESCQLPKLACTFQNISAARATACEKAGG